MAGAWRWRTRSWNGKDLEGLRGPETRCEVSLVLAQAGGRTWVDYSQGLRVSETLF